MARTVGERDRARGSEVSRPRHDLESEYRAREQRKGERKARGERPKPEEATSIAEALEAEREAGRVEGAAATRTTKPAESSGPAPATPARASGSRTSSSSSSSTVPGVTVPMIADVLIITADEIVNQHRAPIPSRLLVAFGVFGILGLARGDAARPAKVFAWGIVIATFYGNSPGRKPAALGALEALGGFLGGKYGTNNASASGPSSSASSPAGPPA